MRGGGWVLKLIGQFDSQIDSLKHKNISERQPDRGRPIPRPSVCLYKTSLKKKKRIAWGEF